MTHTFTVLYRTPDLAPIFSPHPFTCKAENEDAAEAECRSYFPAADVVWIVECDTAAEAYADYYKD